ncbi:hypothetical protein RAS1_39150 [Phycisphaerae bacterium RAS1]|nr:hypothetical protein RAS1_39150 [Phycisphaerae bacterium RAS1]
MGFHPVNPPPDLQPVATQARPPRAPHGWFAWGVSVALMAVCASAPRAVADWADIYLTNGLVLRAEIEEEADAVVIRNEAGTARILRADILRIEVLRDLRPAASQPGAPPPQATQSRPSAADRQPKSAPPASQPTASSAAADDDEPVPDDERPRDGAFPPPPLLTPRDIQRLRINELKLSGPPEKVRVRLGERGQKTDLAKRVQQELEQQPSADSQILRVLARGEPHEKLQAIVKATGAAHADEIEIQSDPEAFALFRQQIVPRVMRGCARSGCHGGAEAQAFRLPAASASNDAAVYTLFAMLNEINPGSGALIDRAAPDQSRLLTFMLPAADNPAPHPSVGDRKFTPVLKGRNDPQFALIESWIASLRRPRPDYGLEYVMPSPPPGTKP